MLYFLVILQCFLKLISWGRKKEKENCLESSLIYGLINLSFYRELCDVAWQLVYFIPCHISRNFSARLVIR